jgi:hypothetical protein
MSGSRNGIDEGLSLLQYDIILIVKVIGIPGEFGATGYAFLELFSPRRWRK